MVAISSISAQNTVPVRWRSSIKMTSDNEGILTVKALIADGWHLYSTNLPKGGPKSTVLDFSSSTGIKFINNFEPSQKPVESVDKMFNLKLSWWSTNVTFTRKFRVTDHSKAMVIGKITFMSCNNVNCMPPKNESVKLSIPAYKK